MDMQIILVALITLGVINATVCVSMVRSDAYTRGQAIAQVTIVWLIPFLGALVVGMFLWALRVRSHTSPEPVTDAWQTPENRQEQHYSHGVDL